MELEDFMVCSLLWNHDFHTILSTNVNKISRDEMIFIYILKFHSLKLFSRLMPTQHVVCKHENIFECIFLYVNIRYKIHREQSLQAGSLLSENPLKSHDLTSLKMLVQRNSDDIITCPIICKLLHWL